MEVGNSPPELTGDPIILRSVGSSGLIKNIETVSEPACEYQLRYVNPLLEVLAHIDGVKPVSLDEDGALAEQCVWYEKDVVPNMSTDSTSGHGLGEVLIILW